MNDTQCHRCEAKKIISGRSPRKATERQGSNSQIYKDNGMSKGLQVGKFGEYLGHYDYSRLAGTLFLGK